jgi:nitrogen fixation NifU-like protein
MPIYSENVKDHFMNPRNVGEIENPDGIGEEGNPVCGDMMTFYIKVDNDRLSDVKFKTFGCGAAIAVSSMVSEMAKGKTLEEASQITNKKVAEALEGLPKQKMHCSNLGADALHKAIEDFKMKKEGTAYKATPKKCYCPFCDVENPDEAAYCTGCGKELEDEHGH